MSMTCRATLHDTAGWSAKVECMRPLEGGGGGRGPASHVELVRAATEAVCVQLLWARVVLQVLADIDAGLCVLRLEPATDPDAAASRQQVVRDARTAAAWLFDPAVQVDRAWICSWLGVEPDQLQKAVRHEHGDCLEKLL
jgi:hypothetical protein